jgi:RNA polymerase sporulation-specific sigma factor
MEKKYRNYDEYADEQLQKLVSQGDRNAEEELVNRYTRLVRICARPYFLAGGDSEDLTQEGMMGLLSAIREYDLSMSTSFKTFAELCIKRRILTAVKSYSRMKHTPLNDGVSLDQVLSDESQAHTATREAFRRIPEEQVLARESESEFLTTYSQFLSRLETQILKYYLEGLSYREISGKINRPEKSVDNAVQRIRRKLARTTSSGESSES